MLKLVRGLLALAAMTLVVGCQQSQKEGDMSGTSSSSSSSSGMSASAKVVGPLPGEPIAGVVAAPSKGGMTMYDLVVGMGPEAATGKHVSVQYTGWLMDGTQIDTSVGGKPYDFDLGGRVIDGWNEGIKGMKVGGKRKLVIPPSMAYGGQGSGDVVPPNATLVFDIELLGVR